MLKLILTLSFLISLPLFANSENSSLLNSIQDLRRIAFGSCNNQHHGQPLWTDVIKQKPDVWIWGGDAVYGDWKSSSALEAAFNKQNRNPDYQKMKSQIPILGTWDDHDYSHDNADGTVAYKKTSQKLYLDFLSEDKDSPRRQHEGIYHSYDFQSAGHEVKVIMLDNRYFKNLDPAAPLLGKAQWEWLENELKNSKASLHFIVTGLSVHSPLIRYTEEWRHYPGEFDRLARLMDKYNPKGRVFLTGDKHFSSIFMSWGELEFMSSGLTHLVDGRTWWYLGRKYDTSFFGLSYGQIDIAWEGNNPVLTLSMRNTAGRDVHKNKFRWNKTFWTWL